ncbi:MAG: AsmA family protein [Gammaproteobacteria bacterium]|nr:AsmA family protein [Gammaproteobacteria bacterium]MCW8958859.1 AsmA family protein [Gammaproteobacteria bacterium]MCW8972564.1 AsmA family protein [Gammaproteobacteria bacterium]MCW8993175.1 AsmA family protein [Gammaproteobacteria bacterium]
MRRLLKWVAGIIGALVGLVLVAMLALALLVDPNDYKEQITAQVKQQTGRELLIEGDIELSFFPWLGLELGRLELGNAEGFGPEPFASIEAAEARVKLLPLLRAAVEMDTIVLHGMALSLSRRADGVSNWDDLAGTAAAEPQPESKPARPASPALKSLAIGGINIRNASIEWNDEMAGQQASLRDFNLTSGAISFTRPIPLSVSGKLSATEPSIEGSFDLVTRLGLDLAQQRYRLDETRLTLQAAGKAIPGGEARLVLSSDLEADLERGTAGISDLVLEGMGLRLNADIQASNILAMPVASGTMKLVLTDPEGLSSVVTLPPELKQQALRGSIVDATFALDLGEAQSLSLAPLNLTAMGIELKASVEGQKIIDAPAFSGELASSEFVPRELMENAGIALPQMADPSAMTRAQLSSRFEAGLDRVALQGLKLQLDQSTLNGSASVRQFAAPLIRYELAMDEIDVDRYLPPAADEPVPAAPGAAGNAAAAELPLELLRSLDIDGTLKLGRVKVMNLRSDTIVTTLRAAKGQFRVNPLTANLYQGGYSGDLRFDVRSDTPLLGMDEKLSGVQAGPLLKDFLGKEYVTGKADLAAKMTARGIEPLAIRKSLNGNGSFNFAEGQVNGINIGHLIRQGYALYKGRPVPAEETRQTDFTDLKGSFTVKEGLVTTRDLTARSPLFRVDGKGTAHLLSEKLDMRLDTTVLSDIKSAAGDSADELKGVTIPITIKGRFSEPKFGVDVSSVLKAKLEAEVEKKKAEAEAEVQQRIDEEKKKLEEKAKDKLKDLLRF